MLLLTIYIVSSLLISRSILKANVFNIASLSLITYWAAYPLERKTINGDMFQIINGIKDIGFNLYAAFGLSFLIGTFFISKIKIKKIVLYPKINSKNNLFFLSTILAILGLICFSYTYKFNIYEYLMAINTSRGERLALLSKASNALPYSIFFIPSITTLLISIKKFRIKKFSRIYFLSILIILINSPILFSYFIESDRSAIIKFFAVIFFTLILSKSSFEKMNKRSYLVENFQINKNVLFNRIKILIIMFLCFILLTFIGLGRDIRWKNSSMIFDKFTNLIKSKKLPTAEFVGVNYTIDFALARDYLSIQKTKKIFTWDKFIFYPLPTYVYKGLFNEKKPINIGDAIGLETKNYIYGIKDSRKLGFALSPIAEGLINFGKIGVIFTGFIYGIAVGFLQILYNKISLDEINLSDIIVINTLGIIPLIMRAGSAGIYNWIFSTSFVMIFSLLLIEVFQTKKLKGIFRIKK